LIIIRGFIPLFDNCPTLWKYLQKACIWQKNVWLFQMQTLKLWILLGGFVGFLPLSIPISPLIWFISHHTPPYLDLYQCWPLPRYGIHYSPSPPTNMKESGQHWVRECLNATSWVNHDYYNWPIKSSHFSFTGSFGGHCMCGKFTGPKVSFHCIQLLQFIQIYSVKAILLLWVEMLWVKTNSHLLK